MSWLGQISIRFDRMIGSYEVQVKTSGSNGYRLRQWKCGLGRFAQETGVGRDRVPLAPGTSKWNKIERRLFSHISMNGGGRPLTSPEFFLNQIGATTTKDRPQSPR